LRALRYLTTFRCVAEACPDTCCAGLRVPVDRASLQRLRTLTAHEDPLGVRTHLEEGAPHAPAEVAAYTRMDRANVCSFLDAERHCGLQKRYGLDGLGDVCAMFPRAARARPHHGEVTGSMACPEALRLLVETPEPLTWVDVSPDFLPRRTEGTAAGADDPTSRPLRASLVEPLREALVRGLTQEAVPLGARWLLAGQLCLGFEGRWDAVAEREGLAGELERCARHGSVPAGLEAQRLLTSLDLPLEKVLELLTGLVSNRLALPHPTRVAELMARAGPVSTWGERFMEARRALEGPLLRRIERNLALVAANALLRNPVALDADPTKALGTLMLSSTLASVLLTLQLTGAEVGQDRVDTCTVETLQVLAKYLDGHEVMKTRADALFDVPGDDRLRRMLLLAKVFPAPSA